MTHDEILTTLGHYVDYLIAGSTAEAPLWNIEKVRSGKLNKWNYIDGCMITACLSLYQTTGDEKFLAFSRNFLDYFVKDHGVIETYDPQEYNLDNVNQGKNLFTLYDLTGEQRYRDAIETIRSQLETQPACIRFQIPRNCRKAGITLRHSKEPHILYPPKIAARTERLQIT